MEFMKVLACFTAIVASGKCDLDNIGLTSGLRGGLVTGIGGNPGLGAVGLGRLGCNCPFGTVCDVTTGACVPQTGGLVTGIGGPIGVGGTIGVGGPIGVGGTFGGLGGAYGPVGGAVAPIDIGYDGLDDFGNPIVVGGGLRKGMVGGGLVGGTGYGKRLIGGCGVFSRFCRATRLDRYPKCRYTYNARRHRCVRVFVRNSCRHINGLQANLFHSIHDCQQQCY